MAEKYKEPDKIQKYMASLEANLEDATGKSLAQWVKIARKCPHDKPGARLKWLKQEHGLSMSRAELVLSRTFGGEPLGNANPNALVDNLFSKGFSEQRPLYEKVAAFVAQLGAGTVSPRKGYVALYRLKQFGAIKPRKAGLVVGLALQKYPKSKRLIDVKNFGGGDRNKKALVLTAPKDFDDEAKSLIKAAWDES